MPTTTITTNQTPRREGAAVICDLGLRNQRLNNMASAYLIWMADVQSLSRLTENDVIQLSDDKSQGFEHSH